MVSGVIGMPGLVCSVDGAARAAPSPFPGRRRSGHLSEIRPRALERGWTHGRGGLQFPSRPSPPQENTVPMKTATARRMSAEDTLALWQQYKATNDRKLRDRLVLTFAPLVKYIVYKKAREMPARCEVEDFISCGLEALMISIDRYDPAKGATLEQYAWTRIHGAVLDELRRQDWAPRSVRRWERDIERAADAFTALHRRRPNVEELAGSMGCTVDELRRRRDEITASDMTSLNTLVLSDDETTIERIDTLASSDVRVDPEHASATEEAK